MPDQSRLLEQLSLEQILGTIPSGLFLVDRDRRIIFWNRTAAQITGYSAAEVVGKPCSDLLGIPCDGDCKLYDPSVPKPILAGECSIVTRSGESLHLLKNVACLRDAEGRILGGVESFIDVTRQHTLEQELRQQAALLETRVAERTAALERSEARFRAVLEAMDDLAYIATPDYRIAFINRALREQFGEITGKPCYRELHGLDSVCPWCPMAKILNHETVRDERRMGAKGRTYEIIHSPLESAAEITSKLAVCRDISERKATETALREANSELDAFTHSISHDLRGILAPVVTYMDFLRLQYRNVLDEQILQILGEVERQSERAITLLDDLLNLAQVGHVTPTGQPTAVERLVQEVLAELELLPPGARHQLSIGQLPPSWVPESLLYQVFANLIGNALHYTRPANGPIEIGCRQEDQFNVYFVRDHGSGVSPREREAIFEIFYRGKIAKGKRGSGVGLAIVRKIALRCQGSAWVEDTPGGGATFCVALPKTAPEDLIFGPAP